MKLFSVKKRRKFLLDEMVYNLMGAVVIGFVPQLFFVYDFLIFY